MNKIHSKEIFIKGKIRTPKYFSINKLKYKKNKIRQIINSKNLKFPIVVKPINEGSSLGVEICMNKKKLFYSMNHLYKKYDELIFEEYIGGQEIQVAVINGRPLGAIELIPKDFFMIIKQNIQKKQKHNTLCQQDLIKINIKKF